MLHLGLKLNVKESVPIVELFFKITIMSSKMKLTLI